MPSTINGLIVFLVALIPGVPGETAFSRVTGLDWREDRLRRIIRIVIISVGGLVLYILTDDFVSWTGLFDFPDPLYIMPAQIGEAMTRNTLTEMAWAYIGHVVCASAVGAGSGLGWKKLAHATGRTPYPSSWDDLINTYSDEHWVIVTLTDGTTYAGVIETADTGVAAEERDMLLREPALYDQDENAYVVEHYQHLFLPSALIASVAVVYDEELDEGDRLTDVGQQILTTHPDPSG